MVSGDVRLVDATRPLSVVRLFPDHPDGLARFAAAADAGGDLVLEHADGWDAVHPLTEHWGAEPGAHTEIVARRSCDDPCLGRDVIRVEEVFRMRRHLSTLEGDCPHWHVGAVTRRGGVVETTFRRKGATQNRRQAV